MWRCQRGCHASWQSGPRPLPGAPPSQESEREAAIFGTDRGQESGSWPVRRGEMEMPAATQKIVLSSSRDVPFNKLVLSQSNVRRIKAGVSVEEFAEDRGKRGILQSLSLPPGRDA